MYVCMYVWVDGWICGAPSIAPPHIHCPPSHALPTLPPPSDVKDDDGKQFWILRAALTLQYERNAVSFHKWKRFLNSGGVRVCVSQTCMCVWRTCVYVQPAFVCMASRVYGRVTHTHVCTLFVWVGGVLTQPRPLSLNLSLVRTLILNLILTLTVTLTLTLWPFTWQNNTRAYAPDGDWYRLIYYQETRRSLCSPLPPARHTHTQQSTLPSDQSYNTYK